LFVCGRSTYFILKNVYVSASFCTQECTFFSAIPRKFGFSYDGSTDVKSLKTSGITYITVLGSLIWRACWQIDIVPAFLQECTSEFGNYVFLYYLPVNMVHRFALLHFRFI
jgi:hypothetical protein